MKGFEAVVYEEALLKAENAALRAENQQQKQKRARYKGFIQQGGSLTIQQGQEAVQKRVVKEQFSKNIENIDLTILGEQPNGPQKKALSRCSKCGSFVHNTRTCNL